MLRNEVRGVIAAVIAVSLRLAPSRVGGEVGYAELLRGLFPDLNPVVDDLFLLEAHQVAGLVGRAPSRELAEVLHAHPRLHRYLNTRYPPIAESLVRLLAAHDPANNAELRECEQAVVWEIVDWIVYQRAPESYDTAAIVDWDIAALTEVADPVGKVVIDAGAGTGRVAFSLAPDARHVFAVEPVTALRRYLRDKAAHLGIGNVYVLDGFLHAIPLPDDSADVLVTLQAIGWHLDEELVEIKRVVKPGGTAVHLFGAGDAASFDHPVDRSLEKSGYRSDRYEETGLLIQRCWKQFDV
ncbi:MAG: class I SAM-dependent methyltransferase [bacterium]|nr:class I SAM-dependent methyltransferase [bacterium]